MIRSLWSGVSGLTAHQTKMDVIGNNIANVNTYGFKASRTAFSDVFYQAKMSATGGRTTYAGNNESAVGYGTEVSSIDKDMSSSSFQSTNRVLDLSLTGDGFFMTATVDGLGNVDSVNYTRYGGFGVDSAGNLVNTLNRFVLGINNYGNYTDAELSKVDIPSDPTKAEIINVNDRIWEAFRDYTEIDYNDVQDKYTTNYNQLSSKRQTIFSGTDPLNVNNKIAYMADDTEAAANAGSIAVPAEVITALSKANDPTNPNPLTDKDVAAGTTNARVSSDFVLYYVNGKYVNNQGVEYDADIGLFKDNKGNYYQYDCITSKDADGNVTKQHKYTKAVPSDTPPKLPTVSTDATEIFIYNEADKTFESSAPDAEGNILYADMTLSPVTFGDLTGFSVDKDGTLTATYANQIKKLGRVLVATFDNPEGLDQVGETAFGESSASGRPTLKTPGTYGSGKIKSSKLEMSNVNLANEFSDMIVTQRGFQANARIITTSDSMLEELVNMKR